MIEANYLITAATAAVSILLILLSEFRSHKSDVNHAYRRLLATACAFCVLDSFWGLAAMCTDLGPAFFFVISSFFHIATIMVAGMWTWFVIDYLDFKSLYRRLFCLLIVCLCIVQLFLVIRNIFVPSIFIIENGVYITVGLRSLAFFTQYFLYVIVSLIAVFSMIRDIGKDTTKSRSAFLFVVFPVLFGILQFRYTDSPYYSAGFLIGCVMIHVLFVTAERDNLKDTKYKEEISNKEREIAREVLRSNTDELTGLLNRRAYIDELVVNSILPDDELTYISMDVNGLKIVNDTLGHEAGDELLLGAGELMKKCFEGYGSVFRIGGDEFAAILFGNDAEIDRTVANFKNAIRDWKGEKVKELSVSMGIVRKRDYPEMTLEEVTVVADKLMYEDKGRHYRRRGVDRRGQSNTFKALCDSYITILNVNLTNDSYQKIDNDNRGVGAKSGHRKYGGNLVRALEQYKISKDSENEVLEKTSTDYIMKRFDEGGSVIRFTASILTGDVQKRVLIEILKSADYIDDVKNVEIYIKDIDEV